MFLKRRKKGPEWKWWVFEEDTAIDGAGEMKQIHSKICISGLLYT